MPVPAPPIDERSFDDLVTQTEKLLQHYSGWQTVEPIPTLLTGHRLNEDVTDPATGNLVAAEGTYVDEDLAQRICQVEGQDRVKVVPAPGAGWALVRVFARLAELVVDRLNQVPDKNLLAFLDLVGLDLLPPQPARAPLTFQLAAGSTTDALVPSRTQVAAIPAEGETEPVIFETERDLVVTRSQLVATYTRDPGRDLYSHHTPIATGQTDGSFPVFEGDRPIEHRILLGHSSLLDLDVPKTITLRFQPADSATPWLAAVKWAYWDGADWQPLAADSSPSAGTDYWDVTLSNVHRIPVTVVDDKPSAWLGGLLTTSLPRGEFARVDADTARIDLQQHDLLPDAGFADEERLNLGRAFHPFGKDMPRSVFSLASKEAFSKPGAQVAISVDVDATQPAQPSSDLVLAWEYWDGVDWQELGRSSPADNSIPGAADGFTDDTRAFTHGGTVTFRCPAAWTAGTVSDVTGFWLQARIVTGNYGSPTNYRSPVVRRLVLGYAWPLPRIDTLQTKIHIDRSGLQPGWVFANQVEVDATKDFFPFGEKPKIGDTLYLASDEALSKPNANITLDVTLTNPSDKKGIPPPAQPSDDLKLRWDFWNGDEEKWDFLGESGPGARAARPQFGFQDGTEAFVKDGQQVTFTCPETLGACEVNGQIGYWIRVRIAAGNYGVEARYEPVVDAEDNPIPFPNTDIPIYQLIPATFCPPSVQSIAFDYIYSPPDFAPLDYTLTKNDFVIERLGEAAAAEGQFFNPFTPTTDTQPAFYLGFERPGADTGFANRSTTLYCRVAEVFYGSSLAEGQAVYEPAAVVWQYWNGSDWMRLGTRDETRAFSRRGLVTFIGPPDFVQSRQFGRQAFWLRALWDRGQYATAPRLHRVLTNTLWAGHTLTLQNELLGSSNGEPNQVFGTTKAPVLPDQRIEVREREMPSAAERAVIEDEEGEDAITTVLDLSDRPVEIWVRWHKVPDFFESGPRSRHYTLDRLTGEIRFGDGQRGLMPPQGRANVRAAWYQTGGGPQGNRPAGTISELKSAVPYVDSVTNREAADGGSTQETLEAVKIRGPKTLRHRDRAVAIEDLEDLAFQAYPGVAWVKGVPARDRADAGSVGLIIVPRSTDPQPIPSLELLGRVEDYIKARLAPTVELWVAGPDWLRVTVTAEIVPVSLETAADVHTAVLARLASFLHPLTGGLDRAGWAFGRKPYRSDLYALIESTPGVDHVRRLTVKEESKDGDVRPGRFLVHSGDHQITMVGGID